MFFRGSIPPEKGRRNGMYNNRHECWEAFWKEQVTVDEELDLEQMKQELFEYKTLLDQMNQLQHASVQPHILVQLAIEQRIQKHQEKVLELA